MNFLATQEFLVTVEAYLDQPFSLVARDKFSKFDMNLVNVRSQVHW